MMKLQRITIERAFIPRQVNVFALRKIKKTKKKTEGTRIVSSLILSLFLLLCIRTVVGLNEGEEAILNELLEKRDSVFEEWEMEENAHIRAVEQLKEQQDKFIRHTEAWEQISKGSNPNTETTTASTTTIESLIATGLELAGQKPTQPKEPKIERNAEEKVVVEKVIVGSSSGTSDDDEDSIPAGLIAIAVLPGVVGVFVILVLIGMGLRALWSKRNRDVAITNGVYRDDIPFQAIPRHVAPYQYQQPQVVVSDIPQKYFVREYPIQ